MEIKWTHKPGKVCESMSFLLVLIITVILLPLFVIIDLVKRYM